VNAKPNPSAEARPYHHGYLAAALVDAALALLDETQDWAFSLREVARRAGVSHNAPYKHFPEKRDLLAAIAARGFEALVERMAAACDCAEGSRRRITACGCAYVAHGIANPALYRLMFSATLTAPEVGRPPIEKNAAAKAQAIFAETLAKAVRGGALPSRLAEPREAAAASVAAWSLLHGLTMLAIDDFVGPSANIAALVDSLLGALLDGLAISLPVLPENIWIAPRL
jgi:AcrR family transcriptional regulator